MSNKRTKVFPAPADGTSTLGMDLRDYFAAQIAAGDAAAQDGWGDSAAVKQEGVIKRARLYYAIADAMLQVRDEKSVE